MDERGQFTFYSSIFASACRIRNKAARADFYDAICNYALNGIEPDLDKLSDAGAVGFISAKPNLDASRKKAKSGKTGGSAKQTESKSKANEKQTASKAEANGKQTVSEKEEEKEKENEIEIENENDKEQTESNASFSGRHFTLFWDAYPRKIDRNSAWDAWKQIAPDQNTGDSILQSLESWKKSSQWTEDGGRFVPDAAKFLTKGYWKSPAPAPRSTGVPKGASGTLGAAELENIQRLLREG